MEDTARKFKADSHKERGHQALRDACSGRHEAWQQLASSVLRSPGHRWQAGAMGSHNLKIDGSLRPSTVAELADAAGIAVPADLPFYAGMGLAEALSRFAFTLSLLQDPDAVRRVASEMCEDAEAEGVTTLEIRFAPQLHGAPIREVVAAALDDGSDRTVARQ